MGFIENLVLKTFQRCKNCDNLKPDCNPNTDLARIPAVIG